MNEPLVLDPCCGSKMFWFDKHDDRAVFADVRELHNEVIYFNPDNYNLRLLTVEPDVVADVCHLPFEDEKFYHVVFDPPHLSHAGDGWQAAKYGILPKDWQNFIHDGFCECMRVLKPGGTLIFKWSEVDIPLSKILEQIPYKPLYGHRSGKQSKTHWVAFIKEVEDVGHEGQTGSDGRQADR